MDCFATFELSIVSALAGQLVTAFDGLKIGRLAKSEIYNLGKGHGVYMLFYKEKLTYVGKANSLPKRLLEHWLKISGRRNIDIADMGFKCLYVNQDWTTLAPETSLIKHYKRTDKSVCDWNGIGFGPHDPGRERENTDKAPDGFDIRYSINDDLICDWIEPRSWKGKELLESLKSGLPYLLRYETSNPKKWKDGHPDYNMIDITVSKDKMSARDLLCLITSHLHDWQATIFPGYMILYRESCNYKHGVKL